MPEEQKTKKYEVLVVEQGRGSTGQITSQIIECEPKDKPAGAKEIK